MRDYVICIDASVDIDQNYIQENSIVIIPMKYILGDSEKLMENRLSDASLLDFYNAMRAGAMTHTSQITPYYYQQVFRREAEKGHDILYISLSGGLSSTYASALSAAEDIEDEFEGLKIEVVDSLAATGGMGLLLMNLSRFADSINRGEPGQTEQKTVLTVLDYIEHHYQSGTLTEAAAGLHLPDYALSRLLKKHTGKTFKELLQLRKLQQAAYLLDNSTLPADRIMEAVGYENSSYFYRSFRAKYGCSPREYRKKDLPAAVRQGEA